jgi:transposase-like protein
MSGFGAKLGAKKEAAVLALLSLRNVDEAARAAAVTPRTLYRWMKEHEFSAAFREARRAADSQTIARLQQGSSAAATTLLKIMLDVNAPASTRVRAADSVLDHAAKAIEIEDIEARVAALEAAAKANQK